MELTHPRPARIAWIPLAVAAAALADAVTTYVGLQRGGQHEANGLAAGLMATIGVVPLLAIRVILPVVLAVGLLRLVRRDRILTTVAAASILFVTFGWTLIAASNHFGWL